MKIVVIGGTGLIGSKTVAILRQGGHEVLAASPNSGVNTITGEGLKAAVTGAQAVIDLANSPSLEDKAVLEFFETSGRNLLTAEAAAGVRHHVALSIVAIDRTDNGYFRAKVAQEKLIESFRHPIHHRPLDPIPGIPSRHRRFKRGLETSSGSRPSCSNPSRRMTWLPSSPMWRSRRRETASLRLPARNGHRSTKSSRAI